MRVKKKTVCTRMPHTGTTHNYGQEADTFLFMRQRVKQKLIRNTVGAPLIWTPELRPHLGHLYLVTVN